MGSLLTKASYYRYRKHHGLIFLGDFNNADICWKSNTLCCKQPRRLLHCIKDNFLRQAIGSPASGEAVLYLVLTNTDEILERLGLH